MDYKFQITNYKSQINSKYETTMTSRFRICDLGFGICLLFDACDLVLAFSVKV